MRLQRLKAHQQTHILITMHNRHSTSIHRILAGSHLLRTSCLPILFLLGSLLSAQVKYTTRNLHGTKPSAGHHITLEMSYPIFSGSSPCATALNEWIGEQVKLTTESCPAKPHQGKGKHPSHDDETYDLLIEVVFENENLIVLECTSSHHVAPPNHGGETYTQTFAYNITREMRWDCRYLIAPDKMHDLVQLMTSRQQYPDDRFDFENDPFASNWRFSTDGYQLFGFCDGFICMDETISERVALPFHEITQYLDPTAMRLIGR
jgi:hypothetical protein